MAVGSPSENGRRAPTSNEPFVDIHYVSVFIIHFFNTPAKNHGILQKLYLDLDLSTREIVELTSSEWSKTSITKAIKVHDLLKGASLKVLRSKYGYKIVMGQAQPNKKEQEVIRLILKLYDEGKSFRQITKHLNDKKVKSKKGGNWDKSVVSAIVKREKEESK